MAIWHKRIGSLVLAHSVVSVAVEKRDAVLAHLLSHDREDAIDAARDDLQARAVLACILVIYMEIFDRYRLRARTLIPLIDDLARAKPECAGLDVGSVLHKYDHERVLGVIKYRGRWVVPSWDGGCTESTLSRVFFAVNSHGAVWRAKDEIACEIEPWLSKTLERRCWRDWTIV